MLSNKSWTSSHSDMDFSEKVLKKVKQNEIVFFCEYALDNNHSYLAKVATQQRRIFLHLFILFFLFPGIIAPYFYLPAFSHLFFPFLIFFQLLLILQILFLVNQPFFPLLFFYIICILMLVYLHCTTIADFALQRSLIVHVFGLVAELLPFLRNKFVDFGHIGNVKPVGDVLLTVLQEQQIRRHWSFGFICDIGWFLLVYFSSAPPTNLRNYLFKVNLILIQQFFLFIVIMGSYILLFSILANWPYMSCQFFDKLLGRFRKKICHLSSQASNHSLGIPQAVNVFIRRLNHLILVGCLRLFSEALFLYIGVATFLQIGLANCNLI